MKFWIPSILFLFPFFLSGQSADVTGQNEIIGFAPDYVGEKVKVYKILDFVSNKKEVIATGVVAPEDSSFQIKIPNKGTQKVIFEIDDQEAELYLQKGTRYTFKYPKPNEKSELLDEELNLILVGIDSTDINYKIASFNLWEDQFINMYYPMIGSKDFSVCVDTFKTYVIEYYQNEKDLYFLNYVKFSLAELEQMNQVQNEVVRRYVIYMNYIRKQPILFGHDKYIRFLKNFYDEQFNRYSAGIQDEIYNAISQASPAILDTVLKKDKLLENSLIREFAMVTNLGSAFYNFTYNPNNIITMLDSIHRYPKFEKNGAIAGNILDIIKSRTAGFPAPRFHIKTTEEDIKSSDFREKYLYIQFFTSWDERAKKEITIMRDLHEKYGKYVTFLSIAMDEDKARFDQFQQEHQLPWKAVYVGPDEQVVSSYGIKNTPTYFLIDPEGFLVQSPALSPSPDGEYETIDKTFYYIKQALDPPKREGRSY